MFIEQYDLFSQIQYILSDFTAFRELQWRFKPITIETHKFVHKTAIFIVTFLRQAHLTVLSLT